MAVAPPDLLDHLEAIERLLASPPFGLFVDLDGTIAPLAPKPQMVAITGPLRQSLATLSRAATVVVLTGRDVAGCRGIVGLDSVVYAGNHGLEWWEAGKRSLLPEAEPFVERAGALAAAARSHFGDRKGILVEEKGPTVALHYRLVPVHQAVRSELLEWLAVLPEARAFVVREGKMVVEARPALGADKGTAFARVVQAHGLRSALVLGDDMTDLDAFRELARLRTRGPLVGLSIAVLGAEPNQEAVAAADYRLSDPSAVEQLLQWLAAQVEERGWSSGG